MFHISVIFPWSRKRKIPQGVVFEDYKEDTEDNLVKKLRKEEEAIAKEEKTLEERKKKVVEMKKELNKKLLD